MVGYAGHVPGKRDVDFTAPLGAVPMFRPPNGNLGQGAKGRLDRWPTCEGVPDGGSRPFREESNGVMVSYSGHVPRQKQLIGTAAKGGVPPFASAEQPLGQTTKFSSPERSSPETFSTTEQAGHLTRAVSFGEPQLAAGMRHSGRKEIARKQQAKSANKTQAWITKNDPYTTTAQAASSSWGDAGRAKPATPTGAGFKVGYRGHVAGVRDTVGQSYWSEN